MTVVGRPGATGGLAVPPMWMRRLPASGIWAGAVANLTVTFAGTGLRFISGIILARALGPTAYGQYAAFMVYLETARTVALLGLHVPVTRYAALYQARGDWRSLNGVMALFTFCVGLASLAGAALLLTFVLAFDPPSLEGVDRASIAAGTAIMVLGNIETIRVAVLAGLGRVAASKIPEAIVRPLAMIVGALSLVYWFAGGVSVEKTILLSLAATALAMGAGLLSLRLLLQGDQRRAKPMINARAWLRDSLPFVGIGILFPLSAQIDALILSVLAPPKELAHFTIAIQLASVVSLPFAIILPVAFPRIVQRFDADDRRGVSRLSGSVAYASLAAAAPPALVFCVWGGWVVTAVFGAEYEGAATPLIILSAANIALIPLMVGPQLFTAAARAKTVLYRLPVAIGLGAALNLVLIPRYGASGAALAMSLSLLFYNAWLAHACGAKLGVNWMPRHWLRTVRT